MLPEAFIRRLPEEIGPERARVVLDALSGEPSVSIRLNPAKLTDCPFPDAERVPWSPYGYLLKERPVFTLDPLFHAGCYYVQDSSAMFVGEIFRRALDGFGPGVTVLDLCAAPGGKTTDLAASLRERFGDRFSLLSNEVMRNRFGVLRSNVRTWGDPRVGVVSRDPSAFTGKPVFDIIVADVPCSGLGCLDTLAEKDAPGAFFVLSHLIEANGDLVRRMSDEGHLVCNHTARHKNMTKLSDGEIADELSAVEALCRDSLGVEMSKFYRPPEGEIDERSAKCAAELGYTAVMWSFAYADWDNERQPDEAAALRKLEDGAHPGEILLLHPTSATNAAILGRFIDDMRAAGWRFGSLAEAAK